MTRRDRPNPSPSDRALGFILGFGFLFAVAMFMGRC